MKQSGILYTAALLILFITVSISPVAGAEKIHYKKGDRLYVLSDAGLVLRSAADKNASKVLLIPYGKEIIVSEENSGDKPFEVNGIKAYWVKAICDGKEGFAFDGFLSKNPAPDKCTSKCDDFKLIELYADTKLKLKEKAKITEDDMYIFTKKTYTNGFNVEKKEGKPGLPEFSIIFTMPDVRISEAFIIMKMMGFGTLKGRAFPVTNSSGSIQMLNTKWNDTVTVKQVNGDIVYIKIYNESVDEVMGVGGETMTLEFSATGKGIVIKYNSGGS